MLVSQVHQLEDQVALTDAQHHAQSMETKTMKESLAEATMELEVNSVYMCCIHVYVHCI